MLDNIRSDYRVHGRRLAAQGFWALAVYRFGRWSLTVRPGILRLPLRLCHALLFKAVQIITGIALPSEAVIGRNLAIDPHGGVILSGAVQLGNGCRIRCGAFLGPTDAGEAGVPTIADNVRIGAGAKLLGPIQIGRNVQIGPNAVVTCDVPDGWVAEGVPAVVRPGSGPAVLPSPARNPMRWPILNVWVDNYGMEDLLDRLARSGGSVYTFNTDHAYHLHRNRAFLEAYRSADVITMDSNYLFAALRLRGTPLDHVVRGSELVDALVQRCSHEPDWRLFLLGARPGVAALAAESINARAGRQAVVGAHGPSMSFADDAQETDEAIRMIQASGANTLIVGLGAPKQEIWIARHRHRLPGVRVFLAVGASIDYQAGAVKRAPLWWRLVAMEWAYRVLSEPRRYLPRYLSNLRVFWWFVQESRGRYRNPVVNAAEHR